MRFEYLTEDWSEGQQSARRLTSMQNCTTVQCFMVHAAHGVKAYQVNCVITNSESDLYPFALVISLVELQKWRLHPLPIGAPTPFKVCLD